MERAQFCHGPGTIDPVVLLIGGLAHPHILGSLVEVQQNLIIEQIKRLRGKTETFQIIFASTFSTLLPQITVIVLCICSFEASAS